MTKINDTTYMSGNKIFLLCAHSRTGMCANGSCQRHDTFGAVTGAMSANPATPGTRRPGACVLCSPPRMM